MFNTKWLVFAALVLVLGSSCLRLDKNHNKGNVQSYAVPSVEPAWIRNGEPILYDGQKWYPVRDVEHFMDSEVYQIGEYKKMQIFVDKLDFKPYERLYTKFAKNKFRYFIARRED